MRLSTIYAYHERIMILPKYKYNLLFLQQLIEDMLGMWVPNFNLEVLGDFKQDLPFGILEWDLEDCTLEVNFFDLIISINSD